MLRCTCLMLTDSFVSRESLPVESPALALTLAKPALLSAMIGKERPPILSAQLDGDDFDDSKENTADCRTPVVTVVVTTSGSNLNYLQCSEGFGRVAVTEV